MQTKFKNLLPVYLKGLCSGKYTLKQASESTGYSVVWLCNLKKRYQTEGMFCLENRHKGVTPVNRIDQSKREEVARIYADKFSGVNFSYFRYCLNLYHGINFSYPTISSILNEYGIRSPESRKIKRKKATHRPRDRRGYEGDLIQIDGTPYPWFEMFGERKKYCLTGAIDDATGTVTGLYLTEYECLYGYIEILRQTCEHYGVPREIYSDRAAIFCVTPKSNRKRSKSDYTKWEELECIHTERTQWQRMLNQLNVRQILAWSPEAKGRVERMWKTIQGQLPCWLKIHGCKNVDKANEILPQYMAEFNSRFTVPALSETKVWLKCPENLDDILLCRVSRKTDTQGCFSFHSYKWIVDYPYSVCRNFDLCISERGIFAWLDGKYQPVRMLEDPVYGGIGETMTQVLKNIVYRYMYAFAKEISV